jgi:3'-phosphoadenosine 5'-phosphosulfate sulfotransferase (PAPS reductase)/FAD synthetase
MQVAYKLNAQTKRYKNLVYRTEQEIIETLKQFKNISVSFSGGKDSTVLLDLVGRNFPDVFTYVKDSNALFPDTWNLIEIYKKKYKFFIVKSDYTWQEIYKMREKKRISLAQGMIWNVYDPAKKFIREHNIDVQCIGLRANESRVREMRFKIYGHLRIHKQIGIPCYYPLKDWRVEDIWSYIEEHNLPYNTLYDKCRALGIPDSESRVGSYLELRGQNNPNELILKKFYPDLFLEYQNRCYDIPTPQNNSPS